MDTEDWGLNMEICDIINHTEDGPTEAVKAIKRRLHQSMGKNLNSKTALFTLTLLETCVKNCVREFRVLVCSRDFVEELVGLECPSAVKDQLLGMLQSWATAFSSDPAMVGVVDIVNDMKQRGVVFPEPSAQDIILTHSQVSCAYHWTPGHHVLYCYRPVPATVPLTTIPALCLSMDLCPM